MFLEILFVAAFVAFIVWARRCWSNTNRSLEDIQKQISKSECTHIL